MPFLIPSMYPHQDNGYDCGVFICNYAKSFTSMLLQNELKNEKYLVDVIARSKQFQFGSEEIDKLRQDIATMMINESPC